MSHSTDHTLIEVEKDELQRLLPYLLMNYGFLDDIGLMDGQMGGILFFYLYAKKSGDEIYRDYCDMLFENIYQRIDHATPPSFFRGLSGIGWGIEYLVKNKLTEGDTDELLSDIDLKIMEYDPVYCSDFSFMTGLGGVLFYVVSRLKSFPRRGGQSPFCRDYLSRLRQIVDRHTFTQEENVPESLIDEFRATGEGKIDYTSSLRFPDLCFEHVPHKIADLNASPIGIYQGITGYALKCLGI